MIVLSANDWVVIGVETNLAPAYEIANWSSVNSSRYAELTSGRTADQILSLDNNAEFLKDYIEYDAIEGHGSGVTFTTANNVLSIKDENNDDVTYIQYPEGIRSLYRIPDNGDNIEWYILCGRVYEEDYLKIKTYSYLLQDTETFVKSGNLSNLPANAITAIKALLLRKIMNGYAGGGVPYMKFEEVSRKRWIITDENGKNITGVAYEELCDAAAVAMRVYDFCNCSEWVSYRNASDEPVNCAKVGIALPGRAVVGMA